MCNLRCHLQCSLAGLLQHIAVYGFARSIQRCVATAATTLQVLVAYKSQVSVVSGAPGKFKDYTTYSPSPVYDANRLFGANSAPFTFTASPKTVK